MKKKILSIIISIAILCSTGIISITASAEPNLRTTAPSSINIKPEQNTTFTFAVQNSSGAYETLSLESISYGDLILISGINSGTPIVGYRNYDFVFRAPKDCAEIQYITYTIGYTFFDGYDNDGEDIIRSGSKTFTTLVNVTDSVKTSNIPPVIENLSFSEDEIIKEEAFSVFTDIFNNGNNITDAVLIAEDAAGKNLSRMYIGNINTGEAIPCELKIKGLAAIGSNRINVKLTYKNEDGKTGIVTNRINADVKSPEAFDAGLLRIQSVWTASKAEIDAPQTAALTLTNPSKTLLKGAEVFLYDNDSGKELTSRYISEIDANSSVSVDLTFHVAGRLGTRSYKVIVNYKDADDKNKSVNSSFSMNVFEPEEEEKPEDEPEKPGNLKIQKIDTPSQIYTGVRTSIPFTLANAGKGTAYNAEVFIINEFGEEIAREYIGAIYASDKYEDVIKLKFDEPDTKILSFYAEYENADETISSVNKIFELKIVNYRVNITDVAGHEMIWNNMANIEFAIVNAGTETMLNVNAMLADDVGNIFKEVYIGTINAGEKKERVRFRDTYVFNDSGSEMMNMFINLTYENADMQEFPISYAFTSSYYVENRSGGEDIWFDSEGEGGNIWMGDNMDMWEEFPDEEDGGLPLWLILLIIGGGVAVVAVVVIIIVVKKKKGRDEDEDVDYFLSQLKLNTPKQEEKPQSVEPVEEEEVQV